MTLVSEITPKIGVERACAELEVSTSAYYRWKSGNYKVYGPKPQRISHRRLSESERAAIVEVYCSDPYADLAVRQAYFRLLDSGKYFASLSTVYRILREYELTKEKRRQRSPGKYEKPVLEATGPNQVWTWDITELSGTARKEKYQLISVIDLFSRYIVGWMLDNSATTEHAQKLMVETMQKQHITKGQLTIHSDRGPQMKALSWNDLLDELGVDKSHSRPRVSNDNPVVESSFKTLKYSPDYPGKFTSLLDCKGFLQD